MRTKKSYALLIFTAALLAGCSKSPQPTTAGNNNSSAANNNSSTANSNAPANSDKLGIAECDDFIAKYESCISDHVPEAQKKQYQENINALRNSWRQLAVSTGANETIVLMCKRQVVQARESMKDFKCQF